MLTNRGKYLASVNQPERAIILFKDALALDPGLTAAREGLEQSAAKLRRP
jgi:hypothetical protein